MSADDTILEKIASLIATKRFRISRHGLKELAADAISVSEAIAGVFDAVVVENYPDAFKGPSVLALHRDYRERPLHVVWGIPKSVEIMAVLVTAYRPDAKLWSPDWMKRMIL